MIQQPPTLPQYSHFVGIDIAAQTASVAWTTQPGTIESAFKVEQTPDGMQILQKHLKRAGLAPARTLVVIEATGTYWMRVARILHTAGYAVSVINPKQAHHFAQALLKQAKNDAIDAQTLAQLGALLQPEPWQPPSEVWEEVHQRLVERDNLVQMRQMLRNQLHALRQWPHTAQAVEARKQHLLDEMQQQIDAIDRELELLLHSKDQWANIAANLRSIKGIGLLSAAWLLVITNGFTTCDDAEPLVSYLGLAPHPRESGAYRGRRHVGSGGHARARRVLYQASVVAACHNPIIKAFYDRLIARGKPVKVARCAAARKLVHLAWAVATKEQLFDPNYQQQRFALPIAA
jgi:transposase